MFFANYSSGKNAEQDKSSKYSTGTPRWLFGRRVYPFLLRPAVTLLWFSPFNSLNFFAPQFCSFTPLLLILDIELLLTFVCRRDLAIDTKWQARRKLTVSCQLFIHKWKNVFIKDEDILPKQGFCTQNHIHGPMWGDQESRDAGNLGPFPLLSTFGRLLSEPLEFLPSLCHIASTLPSGCIILPSISWYVLFSSAMLSICAPIRSVTSLDIQFKRDPVSSVALAWVSAAARTRTVMIFTPSLKQHPCPRSKVSRSAPASSVSIKEHLSANERCMHLLHSLANTYRASWLGFWMGRRSEPLVYHYKACVSDSVETTRSSLVRRKGLKILERECPSWTSSPYI